jgi:DNA-binding CsgD family transcriptional regulator
MPSTREIAELLGLIYEAARDQNIWPLVTERLADLTNAEVCQLSMFDLVAQASVNIETRLPSDAVRHYANYWVHHNPLIKPGLRHPVGKVLSMYDLVPKEELIRTPIYNEFFAPLRLEEKLGALLVNDQSRWAAFGIWRPAQKGAFDRSAEDLLHVVVPHLQRALGWCLQLSELAMMRKASADVLDMLQQPSLVVDSSCRVLFANRAADEILADLRPLRRDVEGVLRATKPAETAALRQLLATAAERNAGGAICDSRRLRLTRDEGRLPLSVLVAPLASEQGWLVSRHASAVLFLFDPERICDPTADTLRQEFGFTAAEAAVALEILNGRGLKFAARRLGVSPTTIRTHLTAVFHKTTTRRQAELVRVLLQRGRAIRSPSPVAHAAD